MSENKIKITLFTPAFHSFTPKYPARFTSVPRPYKHKTNVILLLHFTHRSINIMKDKLLKSLFTAVSALTVTELPATGSIKKETPAMSRRKEKVRTEKYGQNTRIRKRRVMNECHPTVHTIFVKRKQQSHTTSRQTKASDREVPVPPLIKSALPGITDTGFGCRYRDKTFKAVRQDIQNKGSDEHPSIGHPDFIRRRRDDALTRITNRQKNEPGIIARRENLSCL